MIQYLNTDLDLVAAGDLTPLAAALDAQGVHPLHVDRREDGVWYATFETDESYVEPDPNIAMMLAVIESLDESQRGAWWGCTVREFNLGYECGDEPWAFNHVLTRQTLRRMADVGATLRITLYPPAPPGNAG